MPIKKTVSDAPTIFHKVLPAGGCASYTILRSEITVAAIGL